MSRTPGRGRRIGRGREGDEEPVHGDCGVDDGVGDGVAGRGCGKGSGGEGDTGGSGEGGEEGMRVHGWHLICRKWGRPWRIGTGLEGDPRRDVESCTVCGRVRLSKIQFVGSQVREPEGWWERWRRRWGR